MPSEPYAGGSGLPAKEPIPAPNPRAGTSSRSAVSSATDITLPKLKDVRKDVQGLDKDFKGLFATLKDSTITSAVNKVSDALAKFASGRGAGSGTGYGGAKPNVFQTQGPRLATDIAKGGMIGAAPGGGGGGLPPPPTQASFFAQPGPGGGSGPQAQGPGTADMTAGSSLGSPIGSFMNNLMGGNGILGVAGAALNGLPQMYGAVAGSGIQYAYNRINGPQGNLNTMLNLSNALAPNATMMTAAGAGGGNGMQMREIVRGLSQRMPVMGTQNDMMQTILAGQSVGSLMSGTPSRNGFFESVRQMQALNPGMAPGTSAGTLAGYMGNVKAQQTGAFLGEGAFTMIGSGGRYKTLAEWAAGITKFLEQQRPGGEQGKQFTPEQLITQNFPGSNINTWFQIMGVPQTMVDYWWQYVLTNRANVPASQVTSDTLQGMVSKDRGLNLGTERLKNVTQGTRRDYLMGGQMYQSYAAKESADRRFNVSMQATDYGLGQMLKTTNIGRMLSLLPTPIMEMLLPILTGVATSPIGGAASLVGGAFEALGDPGGDMPYGAPAGSYGGAGGIDTAHLSPDLAKRVNAMMKANPKLKMSSSYRDTVTQNRLRRNGAGAVGHPSRSAHTRGWAADIGPTSQMGWLMQNAGKFGLQTAANQGEPWHIQMGGTMPLGDPGNDMPYGGLFDIDPLKAIDPSGLLSGASGLVGKGVSKFTDIAGNLLMKAFEFIMENTLGKMMGLLEGLVQKFATSSSYTGGIDTLTQLYSRLMLAPLKGLVNLGGKAPDSASGLFDAINRETAPVSIPIIGFKGFDPDKESDVTLGDPGFDPRPLMTTNGNKTVVFKIENIDVGTIGGTADARRVASTLVDHLEEETRRRDWSHV